MFLGVDGGGTKTALCLVTRDGRVAASVQAPSCYYLGSSEGITLVERVLRDGITELCARAGITVDEITYGFVALPSYGEVESDVAALDTAPGSVLGHDRYACGNDMVAGWAGSLGAADGVNVVSGTGSMSYGERAGSGVRVGGWGNLLGDEGSAHWIGLRGLQAFTQMSDGRLPRGALAEAMMTHIPLADDLDVIAVTMLRWQGDRRKIASLSRVVSDAAEQGDEQAQAILAEASVELVRLVETARRRLGFDDAEVVQVSHSGGVFSSPRVKAEFTRLLMAEHPSYVFRTPLFTPVVGAALYAARIAGSPLSDAALARLRG
ncbi:N-acetylglucosamine kinase [Xylanimonas sp. McL0601]|uniref:N-acetylglucosamine kinase n=1 Tax=Xylanimonas sp. McL0601 TaxID=3414739 RepID=UPI003CF7458B